MRRFAWLAVAAWLSGCSLGMGSAYVGQWRARDTVDYQICVEDAAGRCVERHEVRSRLEARRFMGIIVTLPAVGVSTLSVEGQREVAYRVLASAEYLRGAGQRAFGVRVGAQFDGDGDRVVITIPVTALGHLNLSDRFAVYGGAGLSPFNRLAEESDGSSLGTSYLGVHGVAGLRTVLSGAQETRIVLSGEASSSWFGAGDVSGTTTGLSLHLGIFL